MVDFDSLAAVFAGTLVGQTVCFGHAIFSSVYSSYAVLVPVFFNSLKKHVRVLVC